MLGEPAVDAEGHRRDRRREQVAGDIGAHGADALTDLEALLHEFLKPREDAGIGAVAGAALVERGAERLELRVDHDRHRGAADHIVEGLPERVRRRGLGDRPDHPQEMREDLGDDLTEEVVAILEVVVHRAFADAGRRDDPVVRGVSAMRRELGPRSAEDRLALFVGELVEAFEGHG